MPAWELWYSYAYATPVPRLSWLPRGCPYPDSIRVCPTPSTVRSIGLNWREFRAIRASETVLRDARGNPARKFVMWDMLYYLAIVLFLAVAMIGGAYAVRQYLGGGPLPSVGTFFSPKPMRRLSVSEQFNIDSKRRLILIRRDGVEHLIMTGGPVDMLIETGIQAPAALDSEGAVPAPAPQKRVDHTLS